MRRRGPAIHAFLLLGCLLLLAFAARAEPAASRLAVLARGANITNWFRYPPRQDAASIRAYIGDAALADLHSAGFTFVRLAVQPEFVFADPARLALLAEAIGRIERQGLAVVVELHPTSWHLETSAADRAALAQSWRALAPLLARFDQRITFPEILNEPVFAGQIAAWENLQAQLLPILRGPLPAATIILTGNDWSSLDGLGRLHPVGDPNVIYTFHFYEPAVLIMLGSWQAGVDPAQMARLPFPVAPPCPPAGMSGVSLALARYYCGGKWDAPALAARLGLGGDWAASNQTTVLAGEFGISGQLNTQARLAWIAAVRRALEAQGIGWAIWGYDDAMGLGVPRPPGARPRLNPEVLRALGLHPPG